MARRGGSGGRGRGGRGRGGRRRGILRTGFDRLRSTITAVALLATGALVASWWIEWREAESPDPRDPAVVSEEAGRRLKVEVLNGSGEPGAAGVIGDILLDFGYDVVAVDNADHFDYPTTHVLDRSGVGEPVAEVAHRIGVDSIVAAPDPDLLLDATVILGRDWRTLER